MLLVLQLHLHAHSIYRSCELRSAPPKLVITRCTEAVDGNTKFFTRLHSTIINSEQMVLGPDCPVWVIVSNSDRPKHAKHSLFSNEHPNYLVVQFFVADDKKDFNQLADSFGSSVRDAKSLEDIRHQVRILQFIVDRSPSFLLIIFDNISS
jgi:hypothetical protein